MASTLIDGMLGTLSEDTIQEITDDVTNLPNVFSDDTIIGEGRGITQSFSASGQVLCGDKPSNQSCEYITPVTSSFYKRHRTLVMSLYFIILCVGLLLNIIISRFIKKSRTFRNSASIVLINLALIDCLHCIILTIPIVSIVAGLWTRDARTCAAFGFLFHCMASVSLNNIAAIAIERFFSVVKNHRGHVTRRRWRWAIIGVWVIGVLESLPLLVEWSDIFIYPNLLVCTLHWPWSNQSHLYYFILYFVFAVAVPLIVQVSCYCKIYARVSSVARRVRYSRMSATALFTSQPGHNAWSSPSTEENNMSTSSDQGSKKNVSDDSGSATNFSRQKNTTLKRKFSRNLRHEERLARTMILTAMGTYISWLPYFVTVLVSTSRSINPDVAAVTAIMASLSTIYNPIFYVILNKGFRNSVQQSLPHFRSGSQQGEGQTEDNSHIFLSSASRSLPQNKTSNFNTTWRPSIQIQHQNTGGAPDGLDTIAEMSTPAPSPVSGKNSNFQCQNPTFKTINSIVSRKTTSTQTSRRHRRRILTRQAHVLSTRSLGKPAEHSPLPVVEM